MVKRDDILKYVENKYGTKPDYPWGGYPDNAVLRHGDNGKWYGLIMTVAKNKLGLAGEGSTEIINLKSHPDLIGLLRQKPGFLPAFHMNKEHWISIILEGSVIQEEIHQLIDCSYELTKSKRCSSKTAKALKK